MKKIIVAFIVLFLVSCTHPETMFMERNRNVTKDILIMRYGEPDKVMELEDTKVYIWDNQDGNPASNRLEGYKLKAGFQRNNGRLVYYEICEDC